MPLNFSKKIDEVENISFDEFNRKYFIPQKPVKIKGLLKDSPAYTKWTPEYFKKEIGHVKVGVFETGEKLLDRPYNVAPETMSLSEYLDIITSGKSNKRLFLFDIFKQKRSLKNDIVIPPVARFILRSTLFGFFGGAGSFTRIHRDADNSNVFLSEFYGKKRVVLFAPQYDKLLYKYPFSIHSGIDVENPDYEKHPALNEVKGSHTILEKGETLFIPSMYWHYIRYLEPSIGISFRSVSTSIKNVIKGATFVGFTMHADKYLRMGLGDKWFEYKTKKAHGNAEKELRKFEQKKEAV